MWKEFLTKHKGQGYSMKQLSQMYKKTKRSPKKTAKKAKTHKSPKKPGKKSSHKNKKLKFSPNKSKLSSNTSKMDKDRFLKRLEECVKRKDATMYAKVVERFGLNRIDNDFFHETFSEGDQWEIDFWIDYEGRELTLFDISEMRSSKQIRRALKKDLDFRGVASLIETLHDNWSEEEEHLRDDHLRRMAILLLNDKRVSIEDLKSSEISEFLKSLSVSQLDDKINLLEQESKTASKSRKLEIDEMIDFCMLQKGVRAVDYLKSKGIDYGVDNSLVKDIIKNLRS
jgi:hypothetical protein